MPDLRVNAGKRRQRPVPAQHALLPIQHPNAVHSLSRRTFHPSCPRAYHSRLAVCQSIQGLFQPRPHVPGKRRQPRRATSMIDVVQNLLRLK